MTNLLKHIGLHILGVTLGAVLLATTVVVLWGLGLVWSMTR
jgi:hypothetical protein